MGRHGWEGASSLSMGRGVPSAAPLAAGDLSFLRGRGWPALDWEQAGVGVRPRLRRDSNLALAGRWVREGPTSEEGVPTNSQLMLTTPCAAEQS